jgi:hypothetical protein
MMFKRLSRSDLQNIVIIFLPEQECELLVWQAVNQRQSKPETGAIRHDNGHYRTQWYWGLYLLNHQF